MKPGYLYAVEFSDGTVKIGRARNAERRMADHRLRLSLVGLTVVDSAHFACSGNPSASESAALRRAAAYGGVTVKHGREWFSGLPFETAREIIRESAEIESPSGRSPEEIAIASERLTEGLNRLLPKRNVVHEMHWPFRVASSLQKMFDGVSYTCDFLAPDKSLYGLSFFAWCAACCIYAGTDEENAELLQDVATSLVGDKCFCPGDVIQAVCSNGPEGLGYWGVRRESEA